MILEMQNINKAFYLSLPLYQRLFRPFDKGKKIQALKCVNISIQDGEILGVVGPNGAGKTTLLRILADLLEPDGGTVSICGQVLSKKGYQIRSRIGYVSSDERSFFWRLTGRENLKFFARLYGLSGRQVKKRTAVFLDQFEFGSKADQLFRDYSAGTRKKISVIRALLHKPALLLLDEATNSLDPGSAKMVRSMVRRYVSDKGCRAAVWSTHRLEEISQICDRVVMIDSGRIISGGFTEDFSASTDYMLKIKNLNGQIDEFCEKTGCRTKVRPAKDNTNELVISGISQKQFSRIVSMAVKDFGAYIIFAGCIKKEPDAILEDFQSRERIYGSGY